MTPLPRQVTKKSELARAVREHRPQHMFSRGIEARPTASREGRRTRRGRPQPERNRGTGLMLDIKLRFGFQPPRQSRGRRIRESAGHRFREAVIGNLVALYAVGVLDGGVCASPASAQELIRVVSHSMAASSATSETGGLANCSR
jgi:hypothetical protein